MGWHAFVMRSVHTAENQKLQGLPSVVGNAVRAGRGKGGTPK